MRRILALGLLALACAKSLPPAFVSERDAAERAYDRADYREAAAHWKRAAERAPDPDERAESLYREATCRERAGDLEGAEALYRALSQGSSQRAARSTFALADIAHHRGDLQAENRALKVALLRFPNSGLAQGAARDWLDAVERAGGLASAIAEASSLAKTLRDTEVEESLLYEAARRTEEAGDRAQARDRYLAMVRRFPYPKGAHWDDALLRIASLEQDLGDPRAAIGHLQELLGERETARISGSYERPAYAKARYQIAVLYRDELGRPDRARAEFERVFTDHPTSRLRDDALFEAALLARGAGDTRDTCRLSRLLLTELPDSRFSHCVDALCPGLAKAPGRCPSYVREKIDPSPGAAGTTLEGHSSSSSR